MTTSAALTVDGVLGHWRKVRARTRRVALCVPADGIEWRPRDDAWSPGDLLRHLAAIERFMFAENVCGRPSRYHGHDRSLADGLDAVIAFLDRCHRESCELIGSLGDADLAGTCVTPGGTAMPRWQWLRSMVEHEAHHRGQLYLTLRLMGVATPPIYGLTEDQLVAASAP